MPTVTRASTYQKLLDQAKTLAQDGKLTLDDANTLIDKALSNKTLSADERRALTKAASELADKVESPEVSARLKAFGKALDSKVAIAFRAAEKNDGVMDASEARALAGQLTAQGTASAPARASLGALMVATRMSSEALEVLGAVRDGNAVPQPVRTLPTLPGEALQGLQDRLNQQAESFAARHGWQVTPWTRQVGEPFAVGDFLAQRFSANSSGGFLVMAHPDGRMLTIQEPLASHYLAPSAEHGGRPLHEVVGLPTARETPWRDPRSYNGLPYAFERGTVTAYSPVGTYDPYTFRLALNPTPPPAQQPSSQVPLQDAARVLHEHFDSVARVLKDVSAPVITRQDVLLLALSPNVDKPLRDAANSIITGGLMTQLETAHGHRFAEGRITREDLATVLNPAWGNQGLRARGVAGLHVYAKDEGHWDSGTNTSTTHRTLQVTVRAVPGAELKFYNRNVVDGDNGGGAQQGVSNAGPKVIHSQTVPAGGTPGPDGMVEVRLNISDAAEWILGDHLAVTQTTPNRAESIPSEATLLGTGFTRARLPVIHKDRVRVDGAGLISCQDFAVSPYATVSLYKKGVPTGRSVTADALGRFELQLPPGENHKDYELQSGSTGGFARVALGASPPVDTQAMAEKWAADLRKTFYAMPVNNALSRTLEGFPPGFTVEVQHSAQPLKQTFVADQDGKLALHVTPVVLGDTITWSHAGQALAQGAVLDRIKNVVTVMSPDDAVRSNLVMDAVNARTESDRMAALKLFGPSSTFPSLKELTTPSQIAQAYEGARMASYVMKLDDRTRSEWQRQIEYGMQSSGKPEALLAFKAVLAAYSGQYSRPDWLPFPREDWVGVKEEVRAGYNQRPDGSMQARTGVHAVDFLGMPTMRFYTYVR